MWKSSAFALLLLTTPAHAQAPDAAAVPGPTVGPTSDDPFQKGTIGITLPITVDLAALAPPEPSGVPVIDLLYFMDDKTALDLIAGINLHREATVNDATPPMTVESNVFGFAVGLGYRMYTHKGKLHAFIEPQAQIIWGDASNSAAFELQVAALFGAERMLADWFSLSGAIGGALNFADKFDDIQLAPVGQLAANFYWR